MSLTKFCARKGLVKNSFQSVFLGPYAIPHAYQCQAGNIFKNLNLSIRLSVSGVKRIVFVFFVFVSLIDTLYANGIHW